MHLVFDVATRDTEGSCDTCGTPIYAGEKVVLPSDPWDYRLWCTKACADKTRVVEIDGIESRYRLW